MEATKLHNVITDAINEDKDFGLTADITNLIAHIKANTSDQITTTLKKIEDSLNGSAFNHYSPSNYKILKEIKGESYFGRKAFEEISKILNENSFNIGKTNTELDTYQKKRVTFLGNIIRLKEDFEKLDIGIHFYDNDTYEIGILFPDKENENRIANITKELNKWDSVIKNFRELVGFDVQDTKITLVNNGSLEFFTIETVKVAFCISFGLERLFSLYKRIVDIREARERLKELGVPKVEEDVAKKHEKEIYSKEIDTIVADILKQFASKKIEDGRLNELRVAVKGHLNYFAKIIDKGLIIEITPPEVEEPEILQEAETTENKKTRDAADQEHKERLAKIETIKRTIDLSKEIALTGKEAFKFLTASDDDETEKAERKK